MPPAMTDLLDIWAAHSPLAGHALDQITVDFLLPTGIYIQMDVPREATIQHIKLVSGRGGITSYLFVILAYYSPVGEKAQTASHNHTACQTLSNSCFDRGGCCGRVGVFCFSSTSCPGRANSS